MPKTENAQLLHPGHRYTITLEDCCLEGTLQGTFLRWEFPEGHTHDQDDPFSSATAIFDIGRIRAWMGSLERPRKGLPMMQEITLKDSMGKTLQGLYKSVTHNQAVLIFTDNTFTTIETTAERYDADPSDSSIREGHLSLFEFGDELLIESGIITREELENRRHKMTSLWKQRKEEKERIMLASLKAKYEQTH